MGNAKRLTSQNTRKYTLQAGGISAVGKCEVTHKKACALRVEEPRIATGTALLHDDLGAATGQAEGARRASRIAGQAASLLSDRASQITAVSTSAAAAAHSTASAGAREAVRWDGRLAKADLTALACIQTVACRRARSAERRVVQVVQGAGAIVSNIRAEEDIPTIERGEGAASKAVTAVRCERPATLLAELGLHVRAVVLSADQIGVVITSVLGLERIAASIPFAFAGSRAIASVEVAVGATLIAGFPRCAGQQNGAFGVVAGLKALRVFVVDQTVVVVVHAVATTVRVPIRTKDWETAADGTRGPASTCRSADARGAAGSACARSARSARSTGAGSTGSTAAAILAGRITAACGSREHNKRHQ